MLKALNEMKLQLHHVLSDISGEKGLTILDAILTVNAMQEDWPHWRIVASRKPSPDRSGADGVSALEVVAGIEYVVSRY
jgi:hypothetical protein